ncbi:hypothetical protein [Pseudoalteromonas aurantia]|nr:hypothetical protein [Pseudoalteromonas aurantia]
MPLVFLYPVLAGLGGFAIGSSLGGFMQSLLKLAALAAAAYGAYLWVNS